ncbi:MAG: inositol monophosphatase [Mycobacteriaceae bacterium]|nr:inositol monophosphatase [Mycobacteriaceae bacterium]
MTVSCNDPGELRAVAERLASEAADFVRRRRAEVFGDGAPSGAADVRAKSTPTDPVTIVDTETERLLRDRLAQLRPGEPVLGEEGGEEAGEDAGEEGGEEVSEGGGAPAGSGGAVSWVLDPVDGTVNFVYGLPAYAVSVAAQAAGASVAGAVADIEGRRLYSAALGLGAHVTDTAGTRSALRCNDIDDVSMALLGTGFSYAPQWRRRQAALLAELLPVVRDVRRMGSAALDLCRVAEGQLDAHYEHGLNAWDWAAGALIAAEAGAWVRLPPARSATDRAGLVLAAAPGIAAELLDLLEGLDAADTLPAR